WCWSRCSRRSSSSCRCRRWTRSRRRCACRALNLKRAFIDPTIHDAIKHWPALVEERWRSEVRITCINSWTARQQRVRKGGAAVQIDYVAASKPSVGAQSAIVNRERCVVRAAYKVCDAAAVVIGKITGERVTLDRKRRAAFTGKIVDGAAGQWSMVAAERAVD